MNVDELDMDTEEDFRKVDHIPTDQVLKDISDTLQGVFVDRRQINVLKSQLERRKELMGERLLFIDKLRRLLVYRERRKR